MARVSKQDVMKRVSIKLFGNIKYNHFGNTEYLYDRYVEAKKRNPEKMEKDFEVIFKHLLDFKYFQKKHFDYETFTFVTLEELWQQFFNLRLDMEEKMAESPFYEPNIWLLDHVYYLIKMLLLWWKKHKKDMKINKDDFYTLLVKAAFHDFGRNYNHEEYFHQEIEGYLGLLNQSENGKKIESEWEDYENVKSFENLHQVSTLYSFLDTFAKHMKKVSEYYQAKPNDLIKTYIKEKKEYQHLTNKITLVDENKMASFNQVEKAQYLRHFLDKAFLTMLVDEYGYKTFKEIDDALLSITRLSNPVKKYCNQNH